MSDLPEGRTIADVVDEMGFGCSQVRLAVLAGGINYVHGLAMELIGACSASIAVDLGLNVYARATLFSAALAGKLVGNCSAALVNVSLGRRLPILIGYFLVVVFLTISTFGYNVHLLVGCWFIAGFGASFGSTNWWSLCGETFPTDKRMSGTAFSMILFSVGALVALGVAYSYDPDLKFGKEWRDVMRWVQLPGAGLFLAAVFPGFVDSAHVYVAQGQTTKALEILETMRQQNACPHVPIHFVAAQGGLPHMMSPRDVAASWVSTLWIGVKTMFNQDYLFVTIVLFLLVFTLNFVTYGLGYALPLVLSSLELGLSAVTVLILVEIFMVFGYLNATFISKGWGRRMMILGPFLGCGIIAFMIMAYGLYRIETTPSKSTDNFAATMVLGAVVSFKFIMAHGWLVVYLHATEVFPTVCRSSAVGLVLGMGRLGSICTAYVFEWLHEHTSYRFVFFGLVCALLAVDAIGAWLVLPETQGKKLEVFHLDESQIVGTVSETTPLKSTQRTKRETMSGPPPAG